MKAKLFALFVGLLLVGCGEPDLSDPEVLEDATADAVDMSKLQDRSGVTYHPNTQEPFSGYAKQAYENEQVEILAQLKDGYVVRLKQWQENGTPRWDLGFIEGKVGVEGMPYKRKPNKLKEYSHGPVTFWHENGQKEAEGNFKDGKADGLQTGWYENGQKQREGNFKDGKEDGVWTSWYENMQKEGERGWQDGKLMEAVHWQPNGEKCPETNLNNGNGVVVWYNEDGTEGGRSLFKDGERVDD
jgi:antitoxin component YwqK of YwqJK toxin-antitoxin module